MNAKRAILSFGVSLPLVQLLATGGLYAQSVWTPVEHQKTLSIELAKPFLEGNYWSAASTVASATVHWPLGDDVVFVGELPLAYGGVKDSYEGSSDLGVGNPYLGLQIGKPESRWIGRLGLRMPIASDESSGALIGFMGRYVSKVEAFLPDCLPITGALTYRTSAENGLTASLTGGVQGWVYTGGGSEDSEVFGIYGAQAGYVTNDGWSLAGGLSGRAYLTADHWGFGDSTWHELGFDVGYVQSKVQPTLFVRVPVDEPMSEMVKVLVGFGIRTGF